MRLSDLLEHIVKVKGGYRLVSKKSGRNLGTYPTRAGAEKRERQVQYFKHAGESVDHNIDSLNEFAPGGDEDGDQDPYQHPKPEHYSRSVDFFGQFEADHFDEEDMDDATGEFKGYWYYGGKPRQIAYFKFDNPKKTGSNHPGMGWYYEPQNESVAEGSDSYTVANDPQKPGMYHYKEVGHALQNGHSDHAKIYKNNKFLSTVGDAKKQGVAEGKSSIGNSIKSLYQKIYNAGDDEIEYFYNDSPIFAQYWDEYEGDLDSIIAEVDPSELQIIHDELESYVEQANLAEGHRDEENPFEKGSMGDALYKALGSKKVSPAQVQRNRDRWAQRMKAKAEQPPTKGMSNAEKVDKGWRNPNIDEDSEDPSEKFDIHGLDPVTKKLLISIRSKYPWAKTDLEALLTYIKDEDTTLEKDIDGLEHKDNEHDHDIDDLDTEVGQEQSTLNQVKSAEDLQNAKIADIEKKVNAISSRIFGRD